MGQEFFSFIVLSSGKLCTLCRRSRVFVGKFHTLPKLKNGQILPYQPSLKNKVFQERVARVPGHFFKKRGENVQIQKWRWGKEGIFLMTETLSKQIEGREQGLISQVLLCSSAVNTARFLCKRCVSTNVPVNFVRSVRDRSLLRKKLSQNNSPTPFI